MKYNRQHINDILENLKRSNTEFEGVFFTKSDARLGKKLALSLTADDNGSIHIISDFLNINEMYHFLRGYMVRENDDIKRTRKNFDV